LIRIFFLLLFLLISPSVLSVLKGFLCYKSKFDSLCKVKDIGMKSFLVCLEEKPRECKFSIDGGDCFFCEGPLRTYSAKKLLK